MSSIAPTPQPPYYAVVFTALRTGQDPDGYAHTARRMHELAAEMPGFLGVENARGADGLGITVSYWRDEAAIRGWRVEAEHREAQRRGRAGWYRAFKVRVCRVERDHGFAAP